MKIPKSVYAGNKTLGPVTVNINLKSLNNTRILNLTQYAWVDQKYQFAINILKVRGNLSVVTDSDYLGIAEYVDVLKENKHEVLFALNPREFSLKNLGDRTNSMFGGAPASNQRMRLAFDKLKAAGVNVRKFKTREALEAYLTKRAAKRAAL